MSQGSKGKKLSKEHIEKICEALKKRIISEEIKLRISNKLRDRIFSTETKLKMSEAHKGQKANNKGKKFNKLTNCYE